MMRVMMFSVLVWCMHAQEKSSVPVQYDLINHPPYCACVQCLTFANDTLDSITTRLNTIITTRKQSDPPILQQLEVSQVIKEKVKSLHSTLEVHQFIEPKKSKKNERKKTFDEECALLIAKKKKVGLFKRLVKKISF